MDARILQFPVKGEHSDRTVRGEPEEMNIDENDAFLTLHARFASAHPELMETCDALLRQRLEKHAGALDVLQNIWKCFLYSLNRYVESREDLRIQIKGRISHLHGVSSTPRATRPFNVQLQFSDKDTKFRFINRLEVFMSQCLSPDDFAQAHLGREELKKILCGVINAYVKGLDQK